MTGVRFIGIAAVADNGVIGVDGAMPWHIPEDFAYFRQTTMGGILVMGRRTFESIGRPLPGRINIVVSGEPRPDGFTETDYPDLFWEPSLLRALAVGQVLGEAMSVDVFVIGGGAVFRATWSLLTDLYLTEVTATPEGDTFFPEIDPVEWRESWREPHDGFAFVRYERCEPVNEASAAPDLNVVAPEE
ncbi:MAG: dihydrofolate reductase [Propionibacteriaceae bacterium]|jgi:dihydrofolate reductase|nr:dihydrofolate reductase [Propionibacteriaceae bacterium]